MQDPFATEACWYLTAASSIKTFRGQQHDLKEVAVGAIMNVTWNATCFRRAWMIAPSKYLQDVKPVNGR